MLRDISGASFGDAAGTPQPTDIQVKRAASVAKSATTGKNRDTSALCEQLDQSTSKRNRSVNRAHMRPVNDIFSDTKNRAKFCMPLTLPSAREIEVILNKQKTLKEEQKKKRKAQKPQLNSKQMTKLFQECSKRRFPTDPRQHGKFVEIAQRM